MIYYDNNIFFENVLTVFDNWRHDIKREFQQKNNHEKKYHHLI